MLTTLLLAASNAHAFCGTFVASEGDMTNGASQVALVRQGTRTTLTMANDFDGPAEDFAMLVPVPEVLGEEDVKVVDPAVFIREGKGARVWDEDGKEYVDYLIGSGPMLLGHGHPEVLEAVAEQLP